MLIEFIGLPGSGKSTILAALAEQLRKERVRCNTLRMVAREQMGKDGSQIRFLQRRSERIGIFGCFSFAHDNPALFDTLLQSTRHDLGRTLWTMDMLANMQFVARRQANDTLIFMDEGFLHRGVSAFSDKPDRTAFQNYLGCLQHEFVTIHVATPLDVAIARAAERDRPMPFLKTAEEESIGLANLQEFDALMTIACESRRAAGKPVLTVDGTLPTALAALQLAGALKSMATPEMMLPKKQKRAEAAQNRA